MKLLFLIKKNQSYGDSISPSNCKSGLLNSAKLTADALEKYLHDVECNVEVAVDSNEIDKYVHKYKPDYCILQAIWFTKEKLEELTKLHPYIKFIVRIHSKTPFLAMEGVAIQRIREFEDLHNVILSFNNIETNQDFNDIGINSFYLPNLYDNIEMGQSSFFYKCNHDHTKYKRINIACFGAIRPMKNQLQQAVASMIYANKHDKVLIFHINGSRTEQGGEQVLKNLRYLFKDSGHILYEWPWMSREEFLSTVRKMDLGLQVSLTESFNIVTADFVLERIPIIVSDAIEWMPEVLKVNPLDTDQLVEKIGKVLTKKDYMTFKASKALKYYNSLAIKTWNQFLKK